MVEEKKARLRMSDAAKARSLGVENFPHPEKGKTRDLKPHLENIEKLYPEADFYETEKSQVAQRRGP